MKRRDLLGLGILAVAAPLRAQETWPVRPVRLILPFPPGGSTDFQGRIQGFRRARRKEKQGQTTFSCALRGAAANVVCPCFSVQQ